jgi:hypothetical protein
VKLSKVADGPETRVPWVGSTPRRCCEPSSACPDAELEALRDDRVIT